MTKELMTTEFFDIPFNLSFSVDTALLAISAIAMVLTCIRLILSKSLLGSVLMMSVFSLLIGLCYLFMDAPDVAMTETALGACLSTCVLLNLIRIVGEEVGETVGKTAGEESGNRVGEEVSETVGKTVEKVKRIRIFMSSVLCLLFLGVLAWAGSELPEFGLPNSPLQMHVSDYYVKNTQHDVGIPSIVAAILASYRGFDTLGETTVILVAGLGVILILNRSRTERIKLMEYHKLIEEDRKMAKEHFANKEKETQMKARGKKMTSSADATVKISAGTKVKMQEGG